MTRDGERPAPRLSGLGLARAALKLYPRAWRQRYGAEMEAVLEQSQISWATIGDLFRGALGAHLSPVSAAAVPFARMRGVVWSLSCCWIAALFVGATYAKATEDVPFRTAAAAHGLIGGARVAIEVLGIITCVVVAVAGAPLALTVLRQAVRGDSPALRRAFRAPAVAVSVFAAATAGLAALGSDRAAAGSTTGHIAFILWAGLAAATAAVGGIAVGRALMAAELPRSQLAIGLRGARLLAGVLSLLAMAVLMYAIALATEAPRVAALNNGPLNFSTTSVLSVQAALLVMISVLALRAVSSARGSAAYA